MSEAILVPHPPLDKPDLPMTAEAFLAWEHTGIAEWVNGEVFHMSVKIEHQRVVDFLIQLIGLFAKVMRLGRVVSAPYAMRLAEVTAVREPDVMFVAQENIARITSAVLEGPADLIVEVVSEESVSRDRIDKFEEFEKAGVREYWIIDPRINRSRCDFYTLYKGKYRAGLIDDDDIYHSTVLPGFWLKTDWLWQTDPDAFRALVEILGPERLNEAAKAILQD